MKIVNCKLKIAVAVTILGLFSFRKVAVTQAQSLSLAIWPPILEVMIRPGKSITQVYKIANPGDTDVVLTGSIVPFVPADEAGNVKLEIENWKLEIAKSWFTFQNADLQLGERFVLKAGKEQEAVLRISVPADAEENDYYYSLLFETPAPNEALGRVGPNAQAQVKIGANILLTVSHTGTPPLSAKIIEFKVKSQKSKVKIIDSFDRPEFILRLQNAGQSFFKPMGAITVKGWFNQKFVLDLLPENVLAASARQISCQKGELATPCQVPVKFLLGKYVARLEFGLDKADSEYQKELIFWALPVKLIIGVLTTIFSLIIIKNRFKLGSVPGHCIHPRGLF